MTVLDNFIAFAQALPADRQATLANSLEALMDAYDPRHDFSPSELADLRQRAAEAEPATADPSVIAAIFGKPFRT